jgi:hypothetical protein
MEFEGANFLKFRSVNIRHINPFCCLQFARLERQGSLTFAPGKLAGKRFFFRSNSRFRSLGTGLK